MTLSIGARPLPGPHLADAERGVAQLAADLQPTQTAAVCSSSYSTVNSPGAARNRSADGRPARTAAGGGRRPRRARPAAAPRPASFGVAPATAVFGRARHDDRLDAVRRQVAQEAAGDAGQLLPRQAPAANPRQGELLARPGHGDVTQPALLLDGRVVVDAARVREDPLLEAGDEHHRELQPLGGVNGHQRDRALLGVVAVDVGGQRDPLQETVQARLLGLLLVLAHLRHELEQVLDPPLGLHRRLGASASR